MASCVLLFMAGALGFISIVAQVVLIRELMTVFSGHEFVFVLVLAVWLLGVATGSFCTRVKDLRIAACLLAISLCLIPLTIVGARLLKSVWGIPLGSMADLGLVTMATGLLLFPLTVVLGAVFAILSRQTDGRDIYAYEALGFVAGGVLMTFVFFVPLPRAVAVWSQEIVWSGYQLVASEQTPYGSLVVLGRGEQKSFFENGHLLFTAGDILSAEEVHLGLLVHEAPRAVLLVGGGLSQAGQEALKHPLQRVDYAELDPAVIKLERAHIKFKDDPRLNVMTGDPRVLLQRSKRLYDVVVMNQGDPVNFLNGRFFTQEFFSQVQRHLVSGGIFMVTISCAENAVNAQGKAYARSVHATLLAVFKHVQIIPGERMTFIAADVPYDIAPGLLTRRLKERGIATQFIRDYYLEDRMSSARRAEAAAWLEVPGEISTDAHPVTSLRALVFMTTRMGTGFAKFMGVLERAQGCLWLMVPLAGLLGVVARKKFLPLTGAAVAGFTQMVFQVMTILLVQSVFGYAYAVVGLLTAGFMLGAFAGVYCARYLKADVGAWAQVILAIFFIVVLVRWPAGAFVFSILAGMAGGFQFAVYTKLAGENDGGRIYAADVIGAACGAFCVGLFLLPLWGMVKTMLLLAALNLMMGSLGRQPKRESSDR